jgi:hypothetical protein
MSEISVLVKPTEPAPMMATLNDMAKIPPHSMPSDYRAH